MGWGERAPGVELRLHLAQVHREAAVAAAGMRQIAALAPPAARAAWRQAAADATRVSVAAVRVYTASVACSAAARQARCALLAAELAAGQPSGRVIRSASWEPLPEAAA